MIAVNGTGPEVVNIFITHTEKLSDEKVIEPSSELECAEKIYTKFHDQISNEISFLPNDSSTFCSLVNK